MNLIHIILLATLMTYWGWKYVDALSKGFPALDPFTKFLLCAAAISALSQLNKLNP
jgi:hypothetical protein